MTAVVSVASDGTVRSTMTVITGTQRYAPFPLQLMRVLHVSNSSIPDDCPPDAGFGFTADGTPWADAHTVAGSRGGAGEGIVSGGSLKSQKNSSYVRHISLDKATATQPADCHGGTVHSPSRARGGADAGGVVVAQVGTSGVRKGGIGRSLLMHEIDDAKEAALQEPWEGEVGHVSVVLDTRSCPEDTNLIYLPTNPAVALQAVDSCPLPPSYGPRQDDGTVQPDSTAPRMTLLAYGGEAGLLRVHACDLRCSVLDDRALARE